MEENEESVSKFPLKQNVMGRKVVYFALIPSILAIVAIFPLPDIYYQLLRITITMFSAVYALKEHEKSGAIFAPWVSAFTIIAIIFNPVVQIHLIREVWITIDIIVALIFIAYFWKLYKKVKRK